MLSGVPLALTPAPLIVAVVVVYALPRGSASAARVAGLGALLATIALLGIDSAAISGGGRVQASFGSPLPGIEYLLRADSAGMAIAFTAAVAALLVLLQRGNARRAIAGVLICAIGGVGAGLAGNAVILFGALEIANLGAFALLTGHRRRPGRGAVATLFIEHLAALGLLAAAAELQASTGTSDFSALPGGALTVAVATPWALAGTIRLITPVLSPVRGARGLTAAWAATATVPTAAAVLLRLREAGGGGVPTPDAVLLAALGAAVALGGAALAARWRRVPALGGRGLCAAAAGPPIALAGFQGGAAATAVAVGLCALELTVAASAAWERAGAEGGTARAAGVAAALAAGGLPTGFGTTALVIELTAVVLLGRAATALLVALMLAALLAAAAAVSMAASVALAPATPAPSRHVAPIAAFAVAAGALAALLPGAASGGEARRLAGGGALASAGAGAVQGPAGGWAGGYFAVAVLLLGALLLAALAVAGVSVPRVRADPREARQPALPVRLRPFRAVRRPVRFLLAAGPAVDGWLVLQPQLPLITAGAVLAVLLVH